MLQATIVVVFVSDSRDIRRDTVVLGDSSIPIIINPYSILSSFNRDRMVGLRAVAVFRPTAHGTLPASRPGPDHDPDRPLHLHLYYK